MTEQQVLKSTNLTKIFISSENELWEWLDMNHASEQSFLLVTWKKTNTDKYVSRDVVLDALLAYGWIDGRRYALDKDRTMQLICKRKQLYKNYRTSNKLNMSLKRMTCRVGFLNMFWPSRPDKR